MNTGTHFSIAAPADPGADRSGHHPGRGPLVSFAADLGWRMALAVVAATLIALSAPAGLRTAVTAAAVTVVVERVVRYRRRGMLDAALVAIGMLVVVSGLLGLLLNYLPGGINRISWSVALGLLAIGMLTAIGLVDPTVPASPFRPLFTARALPTVAWSVAVAAVLTVALVGSARSFDRTHVAPVELSSTPVSNGFATVTISAGAASGSFELDLVTPTGRTAVTTAIATSAGGSTAVLVAVPSQRRVLVQLVRPGSTIAVRQLIFDGAPARAGASR